MDSAQTTTVASDEPGANGSSSRLAARADGWLFPDTGPGEHTFERELESQANRVLLPGALLTLTAWLPYVWLDRGLAPETTALPYIRVGLTATAAFVLALRYVAPRPPRATLLAGALLGYLQVGSGLIAGLTGARAEYVGGYVLLMMLAPTIPLPLRYTWRSTWASVIAFGGALFASGANVGGVAHRYSFTDIAMAVVVSTFLAWVLNIVRRRSWRRARHLVRVHDLLDTGTARAAGFEAVLLPPQLQAIAARAGVPADLDAFDYACVLSVRPVGLRGVRAADNPLATWRSLDEWLAWTTEVMTPVGFAPYETLEAGRVFVADLHELDSAATAGDDAMQTLAENLPTLHEALRADGLPAVRLQVGWVTGSVVTAVIGHRCFVFDVWHRLPQAAETAAERAPHIGVNTASAHEPESTEHATDPDDDLQTAPRPPVRRD